MISFFLLVFIFCGVNLGAFAADSQEVNNPPQTFSYQDFNYNRPSVSHYSPTYYRYSVQEGYKIPRLPNYGDISVSLNNYESNKGLGNVFVHQNFSPEFLNINNNLSCFVFPQMQNGFSNTCGLSSNGSTVIKDAFPAENKIKIVYPSDKNETP